MRIFLSLNIVVMASKWLMLAWVMFSIQACTRMPAIPTNPAAPIPENVQLQDDYQKQLQSSRQWQVVAEDLASQLINTIALNKLGNRPFYIYAQTKPTTFTRSFNDFLITTLVNKGVKVSNDKHGSRIFNYKIQLVEYQSLRSTVAAEQFKFSALAAGFVVVRNIGNLLGVDGTALATGAALDTADFNIAPNLEIIITSSVLDGNLFLARTTDVYYANPSDKHLYTPAGQNRAGEVFNDPFYQMK